MSTALASAPPAVAALPPPRRRTGAPLRIAVVLLTAIAIFLPLGLVFWQSFLSAPFFSPAKTLGLDAYRFILDDPDFAQAAWNSLLLAIGLAAIAVPGGAALAFLMARTDLPGRRWIEPMLLIPVFLSPVVLSFGYVVSAGPVGFFSLWWKDLFGGTPWNIYSFPAIVVVAGLTHIPHVYIYASSALRALGSDVEEAARTVGAKPWQVALEVSLPMIRPALLYAAVLVFFLGFEIFGLVLVLGDPEGHLVLATYLYKLTNKLGLPSYHLMAAVAISIVAVTFPLVLLQRYLLRSANRYVAVKGKASRQKLLPLGPWKWAALALIAGWLLVTVVVPLAGLALRSVVSNWGEGVALREVLTLAHFTGLFEHDHVVRAIVNTILIGVIGGALAVACYTAIGLTTHRRADGLARFVDYIVLIPRAVPGLLAGLSFLWVFLFFPAWFDQAAKASEIGWLIGLADTIVPPLKSLRNTIFAVWIAYTVVWLAYGLRQISAALLQVGPELEEAGRLCGASRSRVTREITLPLIRHGLFGAWLLVFLIFEREYSTGVYLLSPGSEVIGSLIVSLWATGAIDQVAALALINVAIVALGLGIALRLGVKVHE